MEVSSNQTDHYNKQGQQEKKKEKKRKRKRKRKTRFAETPMGFLFLSQISEWLICPWIPQTSITHSKTA